MTYDNNGDLTSIVDASGTTLYTWNPRNQLTGISGPGVTASFTYDGLGRREKKTVNGSLTEFLYDGLNPVQETSGATVLANILTGLGIDEFLTRTDVPAGITSSFLPDGLGSALALADSAGAVQTEYTYEPFGRTTLTGAANTSSYQYTGRENDGTGLYYYRARYYHPGLQRFISEDPIRFAGGDINLYAYVANNPGTFSDPLGQFLSSGHENLTRRGTATVGGFTADDISNLVKANIGMDWNVSVVSPKSPLHYMPGTAVDAEKFIQGQLREAITLDALGNRPGAMRALGRGLHTLQDKWTHELGNPPGTMWRHLCAWVGRCSDPDNPPTHVWDQALRDTERYLRDFQRGRGDKWATWY